MQERVLCGNGLEESEFLEAKRHGTQNDFENDSEVMKFVEAERNGTENYSVNHIVSIRIRHPCASMFRDKLIAGDRSIDIKKVGNRDKTHPEEEASINGQENFDLIMFAYIACFKSIFSIARHVGKLIHITNGKTDTSCARNLFDTQETAIESDFAKVELKRLEINRCVPGTDDSFEKLEESVYPRENSESEISVIDKEIQEPLISYQNQSQNDMADYEGNSSVVSLMKHERKGLMKPDSFSPIRDLDHTLQNTSSDMHKEVKGSKKGNFWYQELNLPCPRVEIQVYKNEVLQNVAVLQKEPSTLYKFEPVLDIIKMIADGNDPGPQVTMRYELLRMCTLRNYPKEDKPFLIHFAKAGFYYAAEGDEVICYCCGLRRHSWVGTDVPYRIHQRINPNCKFLNRNPEFNVPIVYTGKTQNLDKLDKLIARLEEEYVPPQASADAESGNDLSEYIPRKTSLTGGKTW